MNALTPIGTPHGHPPAATDVSRAGGAVPVPESRTAAVPGLRELRYFAAAARAGNLGRAAQELNVTTAAISQQLRKLEDALGTALLIRHGRGVVATPAGLHLLDRVDAVLRMLAAPLAASIAGGPLAAAPASPLAASLASEYASTYASTGAEATVVLSLPAEQAGCLAVPLATLVRQRWPDLTLELRETTDSAVEALSAGQADIAMLPDPPELGSLLLEPLATERLGLVIAPRDALADSAQPLRLRDLLGVPLILPNKRHWIRRRLAKAAFQRGVRFDAVTHVDSLAMTCAMVHDGLGCAVLPASAVREELARGALVFRPIEQPALAVRYALAVRGDAAPAVHEVARAMGGAIRILVASGAWHSADPARPVAPPAHAQPARPHTALAAPEQADANLEFAEGD